MFVCHSQEQRVVLFQVKYIQSGHEQMECRE